MTAFPTLLETALAEVEAHEHGAGWDRGPALFALVRAGRFAADDPQAARRLGVDRQDEAVLTPVEQGELPDQPVDELLAGIAWPDSVDGCVLSQEIVILPPSAEAELGAEATDPEADLAARAAAHADRREARLVVGVLRDGSSASVLRLRPPHAADASDAADGDLLTGPDLAPNLVAALLATLH